MLRLPRRKDDLSTGDKPKIGSNTIQPQGIIGTSTVNEDIAPFYLSIKYEPQCVISGSLGKFVRLPDHVERNDWLATHGMTVVLRHSSHS